MIDTCTVVGACSSAGLIGSWAGCSGVIFRVARSDAIDARGGRPANVSHVGMIFAAVTNVAPSAAHPHEQSFTNASTDAPSTPICCSVPDHPAPIDPGDLRPGNGVVIIHETLNRIEAKLVAVALQTRGVWASIDQRTDATLVGKDGVITIEWVVEVPHDDRHRALAIIERFRVSADTERSS